MKTAIVFSWLSTLSVLLSAVGLSAQPVTLPRPASPAASVSQTIGISTVSVSYSRPKVNKREIWGKLVPYGWNVQPFGARKEAPWRAGANENSIISFSHAATLEGKSIPAGRYGLFFVINQDNTGEVILSKDFQSWGSFWYDPAQDQLRAPVRIRDIAHTELLTFDFVNIDRTSAELVLNWEKKQFPVKIQFAVDDIVIATAEQEMKGPTGFTAQGPTSAANYALQNNTHHEKALGWIDTAIGQNRTFAALRTKSGLLKQTGKKEESESVLNEAMTIATENDLNNYGYQLIGEGENDKAIAILTKNTEKYPKSANAWDSLAEAYALKGDKTNAIKYFKKSLSLNPPENVKANSEKYLKQLGAL